MKTQKVWVALLLVVGMGSAAARAQVDAVATDIGDSKVFTLDQLAMRKTANGGQSADILRGALSTGEVVAVHESVQPAGAEPSPLHAIEHSELIMVSEGTVAFEHDGKSEKVGAGGVIFVAFGTRHRLKNVGDGPARYFVIQIGGDTKR